MPNRASPISPPKACLVGDADQAVSRALGARNHLPRPAAHPAPGPDAALRRPPRPPQRDVGAAGPLPGPADRHHRRRRHRLGHRPRPASYQIVKESDHVTTIGCRMPSLTWANRREYMRWDRAASDPVVVGTRSQRSLRVGRDPRQQFDVPRRTRPGSLSDPLLVGGWSLDAPTCLAEPVPHDCTSDAGDRCDHFRQRRSTDFEDERIQGTQDQSDHDQH